MTSRRPAPHVTQRPVDVPYRALHGGQLPDVTQRGEQLAYRAVRVVGTGDLAVNWAAERQHGSITAAQARVCGLGRTAISGRCGRGHWRVLQPRVFLVAGGKPTDHARHSRGRAHLLARGDRGPCDFGLDVGNGRSTGVAPGRGDDGPLESWQPGGCAAARGAQEQPDRHRRRSGDGDACGPAQAAAATARAARVVLGRDGA